MITSSHRSITRTSFSVIGALVATLWLALNGGCEASDASDRGPIHVEASFGELGSSPGQFEYPRAMAMVPAIAGSTQGPSLVIIDKTARVQRFDASTREFLGGFQMPEWELGKPTGVSVGPHPKDPSRMLLWVADTHYHRVLAYDLPAPGPMDTNAEPLFSFGEYGNEPGQFVFPTDVEVITDDSGSVQMILVSEYGGNDRITVFTISDSDDIQFVPTATIGRFGNAGEDDSNGDLVLHRPQDMAYDAARGQLVIADALNHRILRVWLDKDRFGSLADVFGGPGHVGRALGELDHPYSVAILHDGNVLVSEFGASRVQWLNLDTGESLGSFGIPGRRVGELANPWEVVVIAKHAWVLDSGNNRVIAFRSPLGGAG